MTRQELQQCVNDMNNFADYYMHKSCVLERTMVGGNIWFTARKSGTTIVLGTITTMGLNITNAIPKKFFKSQKKYEEWRNNG